jgi:hypothetical protein
MKFVIKSVWSALLLIAAGGLATPVSARLADTSELRSATVFREFATGRVVVDSQRT